MLNADERMYTRKLLVRMSECPWAQAGASHAALGLVVFFAGVACALLGVHVGAPGTTALLPPQALPQQHYPDTAFGGAPTADHTAASINGISSTLPDSSTQSVAAAVAITTSIDATDGAEQPAAHSAHSDAAADDEPEEEEEQLTLGMEVWCNLMLSV